MARNAPSEVGRRIISSLNISFIIKLALDTSAVDKGSWLASQAQNGEEGVVREVYLDYNGSTPLDPRVAEVMVPVLTERVGNAASIHRFGRRQTAAVDEAREHIAAMVGGHPSNVVFTSGATEANNLALRGTVEDAPADRSRIVISAVEHASVCQTALYIAAGVVSLRCSPRQW